MTRFCRSARRGAGLIAAALVAPSAARAAEKETKPAGEAASANLVKKAPVPPAADRYAWKNLFDGKTLDGWKMPQFGGEGKVYVKDGAIVMEPGSMMTGVTWTGKLLKNNYELALEGMRLDG